MKYIAYNGNNQVIAKGSSKKDLKNVFIRNKLRERIAKKYGSMNFRLEIIESEV